MFNLILIGILVCKICKLEEKVDKYSKVVGNLKIDDLDDDFWGD